MASITISETNMLRVKKRGVLGGKITLRRSALVTMSLIFLLGSVFFMFKTAQQAHASSQDWVKSGLSDISSGVASCALANGRAYCWGNIGNETLLVPVPLDTVNGFGVLAGKTITDVGSGPSAQCVVADGKAYCWGGNNRGEVGDGTYNYTPTPVAVDTSGVLAGKTVTKMSGGGWGSYYRTCAVADGKPYCWGDNTYGQLGDGTNTSSSTPVAVDTSGVLAGKTVVDINTNSWYTTCALTSDGEVYCWGQGSFGQLGQQSNADSNVPVAVDTTGVLAGKTVNSLGLGYNHACVSTTDGGAYCWGYDNEGELGTGAYGSSLTPVAVDTSGVMAGKTIVSVDAGNYMSCAIATSGEAYCWGGSVSSGIALGDAANTMQSNTPVEVDRSNLTTGETIQKISVGGSTCFMSSLNKVYCFGSSYGNHYLGNNSNTGSSIAVSALSLTPEFVSVSPNSAQVNESGVNVNIKVKDLLAGARVWFGSQEVAVTSQSGDTLSVTVPESSTSGPVDITITNPDGESVTTPNAFTYRNVDDPYISYATQTTGLINTTINSSIQGGNFDDAAVVTVGGIPAEIIQRSSYWIAFTVPASTTTKNVDVAVTNPNGSTATSPYQFSYVTSNPPHISSTLNEQVQINNDTTTAIVYGNNFDNGDTVSVNGRAAVVNSFGVGHIAYTVPSSPDLGPADVTVTNSVGESYTYQNGITYIPKRPPFIVSIPDKVPINSSTTQVAVYGNDFDVNATVLVGGQPVQITNQTSSYIQFTAPLNSTIGAVDVTVTNIDGQSTTLQDGLEYVAPTPPTIDQIYGSQGTTIGGEAIAIAGNNFSDPTVTIGGNIATLTYTSSTYLSLIVPPSTHSGMTDITVTNQDGTSATSNNAFEYVQTNILPNQFKRAFGENGTGNGQFNYPEGIVADTNGYLYVTDSALDRVQVFDKNGSYLRQFGGTGTGDGQFDYPTSIKIGLDGNLYVLDTNNKRVQVFNKSGVYIRQIDVSAAGYSEGMAFNSKGDMYITDCDTESSVKIYASNGSYLRSLGTDGSGDGQFDCSYAAAVDKDDNVYISDSNNYRIQVFDKNDNFIRKFGSQGIGEGQLGWVEDLTVDKSGNILVVDSRNNRIQVFDKDGSYLGQIGKPGTGSGEFDWPNSISIGQNGDLYITDYDNSRVQIFEGMKQNSAPVSEPAPQQSTKTPTPTSKKEVAENSITNEDTGQAKLEQSLTVNGETPLTGEPTIPKRPTFTGVASPFANIVITIHSDPVTCKTQADADGRWTCTLDRDLPSGTHHVTIELTNQDGTKTTLGPYAVEVKGGDTIDSSQVSDKHVSKPAKHDNSSALPLYLGATAAVIIILTIAALLIRKRVGRAL